MAEVIWSQESRQDLDNIFIRLSSESPAYAQKWIDEVFKKLALIEHFPNMGRKVTEIRISNIREIMAGRYRILYHIGRPEIIEIMAIRHSSRPFTEY